MCKIYRRQFSLTCNELNTHTNAVAASNGFWVSSGRLCQCQTNNTAGESVPSHWRVLSHIPYRSSQAWHMKTASAMTSRFLGLEARQRLGPDFVLDPHVHWQDKVVKASCWSQDEAKQKKQWIAATLSTGLLGLRRKHQRWIASLHIKWTLGQAWKVITTETKAVRSPPYWLKSLFWSGTYAAYWN